MQTLKTPAETTAKPGSGRTDAFRIGAVAAGFVVLAQVPFLARYSSNLWNYRPHYEFFPVVLAVVAYLIWKRWPRGADQSDRVKWLEFALLGAGLLMLVSSVVLFSPWVAAVGAVLTVGGLLLHFGGRAGLRELWPVWALLWLVIPPSRYDQDLINTMQSLTTRASSRVLDLLEIGHLRAGNTLELPGKQLFVAEACSGVHSQLVLVACSAIFVVVARRPVLRGILLMASAFVWATLVNMVRVTTVAIAAAKSDVDLSTGWAHETLGFALVGCGLLLVMSTDQFLGMLLAPIDPRSPETIVAGSRVAGSPGTRNPLARLWNRFVACPDANTDDRDSQPAPAEAVVRHRQLGSTSLGGRLLVGTFCVLGILELAILRYSAGSSLKPEEITLAFEESSLPTEMADWKRLQFTTEFRDLSSDEGACSQIWKYRAGNLVAHVSMDYPFVGWHELTNCYEARGWHIDLHEIHPVESQHKNAGAFVEVEMSMATGERGLLLFSLFDSAGRPLTPGGTHGGRLFERLASNPLAHRIGFVESKVLPNATSIQVQQFLQLSDRPVAADREQAIEQFLRFRERLRANWLAHRGE